ncbi:MAG: S8 family peptidase [Halieaceae bacterium]|jgi:subtilisin family serine protease|nr:S8 family peptidase [Halieaceae bacterium]
MRYAIFLAAIPACLAVIGPAGAAQAPADPTQPLRVFLQGRSSTELGSLVTAQGGTITHDLHLIDAVGALLTPEQLEQVRQSPRVMRIFDDLSVSAEPDEAEVEADKPCEVGGSLELTLGDSAISWALFNKKEAPAQLERLELSWPAELGPIKALSLGDTALDPALLHNLTESSALLEPGDAGKEPLPTLTASQGLHIVFSSPASQPLHQRDFEIEASFVGDCSIELIPGYDDNHENFYYNSVIGVDALHRNGVTGRGITVAVIDSGLWDDPALTLDTRKKPRVLARYDAISDTVGEEVFDASGHGTHMTSIIAHSGPETYGGVQTGAYKGVAPDVNLVSVKAFDVEGQGDFLDIVRAVQWVVDNRERYNIRVLNLSFASRPRWHYWLDPINQAIMQAWASGITVIAAAGNEGPDPMSIGSPGNLPYIITVGAVTDSWTPLDKDDDYIPDFSSRGPTPSAHIKPDIVAPGGHITGLTRPGSSLTRQHPEYMLGTGELVMTGSSQATAVVSGVAALLLQLEPDLSPNDIKCKLMTSAEPAINEDGLLAYSPFQQGHGYVNAARAVTLGQRGCGNAGMDLERELAGMAHSQGPAIVKEDGGASLPGLETMLSAEPAEKGHSSSRRWGVKAHIERLAAPPSPDLDPTPGAARPFDWMQLYMQERETIERLSAGEALQAP